MLGRAVRKRMGLGCKEGISGVGVTAEAVIATCVPYMVRHPCLYLPPLTIAPAELIKDAGQRLRPSSSGSPR